jgi:hypothetical protein
MSLTELALVDGRRPLPLGDVIGLWYGMFRAGFPHALRPLARPTYQRTAEPSPGGRIEDYDGREVSAILLRGPLGT